MGNRLRVPLFHVPANPLSSDSGMIQTKKWTVLLQQDLQSYKKDHNSILFSEDAVMTFHSQQLNFAGRCIN